MAGSKRRPAPKAPPVPSSSSESSSFADDGEKQVVSQPNPTVPANKEKPPPPSHSPEDGSSSEEDSDGDMAVDRPAPHPIPTAPPSKIKSPPPLPEHESSSGEESDGEGSGEEEEGSGEEDEDGSDPAPRPQTSSQSLPPTPKLSLQESGSSSSEESESEEENPTLSSRPTPPVSPHPSVKPISTKPMDQPPIKHDKAPAASPTAANGKKNSKREAKPSPQKVSPAKKLKLEECTPANSSYEYLKDAVANLKEEGIRNISPDKVVELLGSAEAATLDNKCKKARLAEMRALEGRMKTMKAVMRMLSMVLAKSG